MGNKMKRLVLIRTGIMTLILYSATLITYFKYYYQPLRIFDLSGFTEKDYGYSDLVQENSYARISNREDILLFCISFLLLCLVASMFISLIYEEIVLYTKPTIEVNARLKLKDSVMNISGNPRGISGVGYSYNLTFETDKGVEIKFVVMPKQYMMVYEGNKGILKYKQDAIKRFVCFDIEEIE